MVNNVFMKLKVDKYKGNINWVNRYDPFQRSNKRKRKCLLSLSLSFFSFLFFESQLLSHPSVHPIRPSYNQKDTGWPTHRKEVGRTHAWHNILQCCRDKSLSLLKESNPNARVSTFSWSWVLMLLCQDSRACNLNRVFTN